MNGDSAIINAEKKMGRNRLANPYFIQFLLLIFTLGPIGIGRIAAQSLQNANPKLVTDAGQEGFYFAIIIWILIVLFGLQTFQIANSSKWIELSYNGSESDIDWSSSFRLDPIVAVDLGEAIPLPEDPKIQGVQTQKYGFLQRPQRAPVKGHCWEVVLQDKTLPSFLVWLPSGYDFETCCNFKGHEIYAFFRGFPFVIQNGTKATFLRTSYTQDPDKRVIPIGIFTHYDLRTKLLRREIEPIDAPGKEVQGLAIARDNYHRQQLALELDMEKKKNTNLEKQLEKSDSDLEKRVGAIVTAMKKRHDHKADKEGITTSRRQQVIILIIAASIIIAGAFIYLGSHH